MWRPVGTLRVPGVERPEPEAAEGRSKDRIYTLDRAILRPPVFQSFSLTPVSLARDGCACAAKSRRRAVALAGLSPGFFEVA